MTPEEEKALLLRVVVRFAQVQLEKKGAFVPFGATLSSAREVQLLMPQTAKGGTMTREKIDAYWRKQMATAISAGNVRAACTVGDVREADSQGEPVPGTLVLIHLEHLGLDAEDLLYSYERLENSQVKFLEPIRERTARQFFDTTSPI